MDILRITVVGNDIFRIVEDKFEEVGLTTANEVRTGMLGNLKTLTYEFVMEEEKIIDTRKRFMNAIAEDNKRLMPLYLHGDWMRLFVFKPLKT